ncbi:MAG TPA: hypothetical protein VMV91_14255 [Rhodocyclaceae bacterium]|nr:hypothetical protein [Rhodocyclaceae bacterium]
MTILSVFCLLIFWALFIFLVCLTLGYRYPNAKKWLAVAAEVLSLTATILGGTVIYHMVSEQEEALTQVSYRSELNGAYETSLYCPKLSRIPHSSAIEDSCAVVDMAFRDSFSPIPGHGPDYWQHRMNAVLMDLKDIVDRLPPRESPTSPMDKETIGMATQSLRPYSQQYESIAAVAPWGKKFLFATVTVFVVVAAATIKLYRALVTHFQTPMQKFAKHVISYNR